MASGAIFGGALPLLSPNEERRLVGTELARDENLLRSLLHLTYILLLIFDV